MSSEEAKMSKSAGKLASWKLTPRLLGKLEAYPTIFDSVQ
jgi:hypothetical protein